MKNLSALCGKYGEYCFWMPEKLLEIHDMKGGGIWVSLTPAQIQLFSAGGTTKTMNVKWWINQDTKLVDFIVKNLGPVVQASLA